MIRNVSRSISRLFFHKLSFGSRHALVVGSTIVALFAIARIHVRVQTTLAGYSIGKLKNEESKLLEDRAALKMQLAKLTSKKHLMLMTDVSETAEPTLHTAVAQQ